MGTLVEKDLAKLDERQLADLVREDETVHKIGDVLRIGSTGNTDFGSVKITRQQFDQMLGDADGLGSIRHGILDHHKDKLLYVTFDFHQNGAPELGTVKVTVGFRPDVPGGRLAGVDAMYSATHSISSRLRRR
jgi:hypothetical protein